MAIILRKTIPTGSISNWYSGTGGDTTITLNGVTKFDVDTKKMMIKVRIPKGKRRREETLSDDGDNMIIDLKRLDTTIRIEGWLEDDATGGETAWDKAWQLRAMNTTGGPLTKLTIDNIEFDEDTQQAFLEGFTLTVMPTDNTTLNTLSGQGDEARVQVILVFYIGKER